MILTEYVMYRGKTKRVQDLSPTSGYKVDVLCSECKNVRNVYYRSIRKAGHTLCQACSMKAKTGKTFVVGTKFNRLTVVEASTKSGYSICRCNCGNIVEVANWDIEHGKTKSCGCLRSENMMKVAHHPIKEEHWHWKGGITGERNSFMSQKTYKDWRINVFERDEYTCRKCGKLGRKLRAHHIQSFADNPDFRLDLYNGITLCETCHRKFHRFYGFETNRDQLDEFIFVL